MSSRPWFPLFVADDRSGTLDLSLDQHGFHLPPPMGRGSHLINFLEEAH